LLQQPVHERCLAVVDMRDDGDIAKLHCEVLKSATRAQWQCCPARDAFGAEYSDDLTDGNNGPEIGRGRGGRFVRGT
jgi:hypothetical protein